MSTPPDSPSRFSVTSASATSAPQPAAPTLSTPTRTGKLRSYTSEPNPENYVACSAPFYRDEAFRGFGTHTDYSVLFVGCQRPGIYTSSSALKWGVGDWTGRPRLRAKLHLTSRAALTAWFIHCRTWHLQCQLRNNPDENPSTPKPWYVLPNGIASRNAQAAEKQMISDGFDAIFLGANLEDLWHRISPSNAPDPWYLIQNGAAYRDCQKAIDAMEDHGWTAIFMSPSLEYAILHFPMSTGLRYKLISLHQGTFLSTKYHHYLLPSLI
ncbi:hypothetical protein C8J57DRAFT_1710525 [Mycena rebaudengoi]|nr:hypothetical protein C8J57DRAFT_1710525 [Mycena rebaudengoi]